MRISEQNQAKRDALYELYKKGLQEGRFKSLRDAAPWLAKQPAPCFFISARQASLRIGQMMCHVSIMKFHASQRRMITRLYNDYKQYLREHPECNLSRERVLEILVERPAPEFYLSEEAIRNIIGEEIQKVRERWGR